MLECNQGTSENFGEPYLVRPARADIKFPHSPMSALAVNSTPFHVLLHDIGKELKLSDVRYMKYLLQGHINKETLEHLDSGQELTELLRKRGLVSEKKLAFMRKLLIEAKCLKQVNLVDEFREKFTSITIIGEC